jgi:wyosine [tRNA(Phe)-imidazoG37] synthetase (radical SAM superfamily)
LALERAHEKESNKLLLANSKMAEAILAKVGGILLSLAAILEKEHMVLVAPLIRDPLTKHLAAFQLLKTKAESVILLGGEGELDITDIKEVIKQIAEAKKAIALATQMLATLARAPGA